MKSKFFDLLILTRRGLIIFLSSIIAFYKKKTFVEVISDHNVDFYTFSIITKTKYPKQKLICNFNLYF